MDTNGDGVHERLQRYGDGAASDQYLYGDWDGDDCSNVAVRSRHCVYMDNDFNGNHDQSQCYGNGARRRPVAAGGARIDRSGVSSLDLSWSDRSNDEQAFLIYVGGALFGQVNANTRRFSVGQLRANTRYWFIIRARNGGGLSDVATDSKVCGSTAAPTSATEQTQAPSPAATGNVRLELAAETFSWVRCELPDASYDFVTHDRRLPAMLSERVGSAPGMKFCVYTAWGSSLSPGTYSFVQSAYRACGSTTVRAGVTSSLTLAPYTCL